MKRALILTDLQNDFLPGGALAVPQGDEVIPVANRMSSLKGRFFDLVIATQDWHPANHGSFASNNPGKKIGEMGVLGGLSQVMWPDHCVQGSRGAEFSKDLEMKNVDRIFQKGTDPGIDSYSTFYDNAHRKSTGLGEFLKSQGVDEVYLLGLATDYCVKYSSLDAVSLGFRTYLIEDGSRAVNLRPEDDQNAKSEMREKGVRILQSEDLLSESNFPERSAQIAEQHPV